MLGSMNQHNHRHLATARRHHEPAGQGRIMALEHHIAHVELASRTGHPLEPYSVAPCE